MPRFIVPTNANIHAARSLFATNRPFDDEGDEAVLELHPKWVHVEPLALSMIAAWGAWCRRRGYPIRVENLGKHAAYAARMRLFQHLEIEFDPGLIEREEAGRFLPLTQVHNRTDVTAVIANISAMLHLEQDPRVWQRFNTRSANCSVMSWNTLARKTALLCLLTVILRPSRIG